VAGETADEEKSGDAVLLKKKPEEWFKPHFTKGAFKDRRRPHILLIAPLPGEALRYRSSR